jgi:parallel beta-helix repeat protein
MKRGILACALLVALLLVSAFLMGLPRHEPKSLSASVSTYTAHDPIIIVGDAGFNSTNGVVRGDGTQNNPYVIEGWEINASTAGWGGVIIQGANAYFVINDLWIHSGGPLTDGINIFGCRHAVLSGNTIERNGGGIFAYQCYDIVISDNTLRENGYGVDVEDSRDVNVTHNRVMSNSEEGIRIGECENTSTYWNYLFDNSVGVDIWRGHNVTVTWNNISANDYGINASNDPAAGLPILIFHNNLWGNTEQAHMFADFVVWPAGDVSWNASYPQGGNFWSDYVGLDLYSGPNQDLPGVDGVGDTDYSFKMDWWREPGYHDYDYYPLMSPLPVNWAPVAAFTVDPITGDTLTAFRFNASNSSDLDDPVSELTFRWDWEGDGVWDTGWSDDNVAYHNYDSPDIYTVRLDVMNSHGLANNTTMQVQVVEAIPEFSAAVVPTIIMLLLVPVIARSRLRRTIR